MHYDTSFPAFSTRFIPVWRRNFLVWKKLAGSSILGNIADPMISLMAFGFGLGSLLPSVGGVPYIQFLAAGTVCMSTMNAATFESLYSAFSRMHVQRTWDGIMNAPVSLEDVVLGELTWAASKAFLSGLAIMIVVWIMGLAGGPQSALVLGVVVLVGVTFSAIGLVVNALAHAYDTFTYYFTLVVTPMAFVSGVFFPVAQLPAWLRAISEFLPLSHAVALARPLLLGQWPQAPLLHIAVLLLYTVVAAYVAIVLTRRRLLS
ncbi:MAG TPA: ABC transporter permease [Burkholderiales bacterium]|jgi:lipooligosaccharide transport system permease protein